MSQRRRKRVLATVLPYHPRHRKNELVLAFDPADLTGSDDDETGMTLKESTESLAEVKRRRYWVELIAARMERAASEAEQLRRNNSFAETFQRAGLIGPREDDGDGS